MKSWNRPVVPELPGKGHVPVVFDTASSRPRPTHAVDGLATLYVCGITPYDATHLGHAATYLAFDTLVRLWLDAGYRVRYVQNVTDVDDPLLERAADTDRDWEHLAAEQVDLFRADMEALGVIPPDHYVAVTEVITPVAEAVQKLVDLGLAYVVDDDVYFDSRAAASASPWWLGSVSGLSRDRMLELAVERGGDPGRPGKRDPLDPLLWRAERPGEPSWPSSLGPGRPGWHIECSVIAQRHLELPATVNGGGSDLSFPHHEFSAAHAAALGEQLAGSYVHAGMVGYHGEKMSKSLGNLVLVSQLRARGIDPRAIRLAILAHHYRSDWEWHDGDVDSAVARLARWEAWAATRGEEAVLVQDLRDALRDDLNTPAALAIVDDRIAQGVAPSQAGLDAVAALLGVELRHAR